MQEWPDDKLDAFFRKLSEEQAPKYNPQDWDQLRKRLDEEEGKAIPGQSKKLWKGLAIFVGIIFLTGTLVYLWPGQNTADPGGRPETVNGKDIPQATGRKPGDRAEEATVNPLSAGQSDGDEIIAVERNKISSGKARALVDGPLPPKNPSRLLKARSRQADKAGGEPTELGARGTHETDGTFILPEPKPSYQSPGATLPGPALPKIAFLTPPAFKPISLQGPDIPRIAPPETASPVELQLPVKSSRRWAVRAGAGPDFSAVKLPDFAPPTFTWAVHLDYRLTKRLWVQSGYVRSDKKYNAPDGQYTWPSYWQQPVRPESIDATCNMIEIPLNLKYVWGKKPDAAWYLTAGITNYQMQREKYEYNYERPDPQIRRYRWEGSTGWYWLSHTQVSLGYERKLTNHLNVGVEPFVKIPVQRVGFGKVNLYTAGVWLYVNYGR